MKYLLWALTATLVSLTAVSFGAYPQKQSCTSPDAEAYDGRIEQVKGKVTILNHPGLGKTPGNGMYLVFQRDDCKTCLVATHADLEGNYKIFVGVGRYRLIVREAQCDYGGLGCDCYDLLSPKQPRYIDVERNRPYAAEFNIDIVLPKK